MMKTMTRNTDEQGNPHTHFLIIIQTSKQQTSQERLGKAIPHNFKLLEAKV